ncbi:MAG TPA: hypothetical protein VIP46_22365 [Pyrinomonadaceae bacterium]
MKKLIKLTALISTLVLTLTAGILIHGWLFEPPVWLSTSSPNKTYTVELTGDKGRGGFLFMSVVRFNVIRNGQAIVKNAYAHSGDWMDISFELAYPEHAWISENVMRFWRNPHLPEEKEKSDILLISNDTGKAIKYLRIKLEDMFLVFDMQPHSTLKLSSTHQSWSSGVGVEGEFEDGQRIGYGAGFPHYNKVNEPLRYCVSINDSYVKIESPQMEGSDDKGNWDRLNIPKSPSCNP